MSSQTCATCRYGLDRTPDGGRPSPGTVWCSKRKIKMGKDRAMPCYEKFGGKSGKVCLKCKHAKMIKPNGEVPTVGHMWCDKRHMETGKQRRMDCFEE